jgi:hypothetical protein
MTVAPVVLLLGTTVILGLIMGLRYFRGVRNPPLMIGAHVLFGAAAFEPLAVALQSAPGDVSTAGGYGMATMLLIGLALVSGLVRALIVKHAPAASTPMLAAHASVAATALVLAVVLAVKLA